MGNSNIKYIINQSELGAGTRGASMGIDALNVAALNVSSTVLINYPTTEIEVYNNELYQKNQFPNAKHIDKIADVFNNVANEVKNTLNNNQFPLVLAGDHSSAGGTIAGLKMAMPNQRLGVVWIDAHGDLHTPYTTPSGNVHGMPLSTALAIDNEKNAINNPDSKEAALWNGLKNLGGSSPKVLTEDLVFFGVRDTEEPEDNLIEELGIKNYTVEETRYRGLENCIKETVNKLSSCDAIYISFDIDSLDSLVYSMGTGTPVPFGFTLHEAQTIINGIIATQKCCCFEMVEINPTLDNKCNVMAEKGLEVLESTVQSILKHNA